MRKNTLLFGVLSLFGASQAMADDWVIELMKNNASHLELVKDASFDVGYGCIGNTSTETVIGLGEVVTIIMLQEWNQTTKPPEWSSPMDGAAMTRRRL